MSAQPNPLSARRPVGPPSTSGFFFPDRGRLALVLACVASIVLVVVVVGCEEQPKGIDPNASPAGSTGRDEAGRSAPTPSTIAANRAVRTSLPFDDTTDFDNARRGFIGARKKPVIRRPDGAVVWDLDQYEFEDDQVEPPDSVNPSLWRQARLNRIHGVFEVVEGIYQVRGYDLANMTLVAGETGWIVIDPMSTIETATAALELVREHLGERPIRALIYTHSHIDHFGGAKALLTNEDLARGVPVIAPEGFLEEAVSENVLAGVAMTRRATYMFGFLTERSARGHVDSGLGKASTPGTFSLAQPTEVITETGTELTIDGVRLVFQNTPGAEAPAEMMIHLPDFRALCGAENVSHVLHNVLTLRGAKVRDALMWSNYIEESIELFANDSDVIFASHHWPTWGRENVVAYLEKQRDIYKFIHDQTLRLANAGYTSAEIAEQIVLPESLRTNFATRGYYGTLSHNSKAVYQHYFGWFDGNPANLHPLPPTEQAVRYVEAMGGAAAVIAKAKAAYDAGDYRWGATLLNHVVFAEPDNASAAALLADTYDQLGYQAESGPWRDFYLTGAQELRRGVEPLPISRTGTAEVISAMPTHMFFDALAVRLIPAEAEGNDTVLNFVFTDIDETHVVTIENAVLHHEQRDADPDARATIRLTRTAWNDIVAQTATPQSKVLAGEISVEGNPLALVGFFGMLSREEPTFEIVRP